MQIAMPKTFAGRVTFRILIFFLVSISLLMIVSIASSYKNTRESALTHLRDEVLFLTADFEARIGELRQDVAFVGSIPAVQGIMRASLNGGKDPESGTTLKTYKDEMAAIFSELLGAKGQYLQARFIGMGNKGREMVRIDRKGTKLFRVPDNRLQQKSEEAYFKEISSLMPNNIYLSEFNLNREFGRVVLPKQLVIRAAFPVHGSQNKMFGFVIINMLAQDILANLLETRHRGKSTYILDSDGKLLLDSLSKDEQAIGPQELLANSRISLFFDDNNKKVRTDHSFFGGKILAATKVFYNRERPDLFLGIVLTTPNHMIITSVLDEIKWQVILLLILIVVNMLTFYVYLKREISPVQTLKKMAGLFAEGKKVAIDSKLLKQGDELAALAESFQKMAREIEEKNALIKFQNLALNQTALVAETNEKGRITYVNSRFSEVSKYSEEELIGSNHRIVNSSYHGKDFYQNLWKTISSGKPWRSEIRNRAKDGTHYWVDCSIVPFKTDSGKIERFIAINYDITEKKQQEENLKEKTRAKNRFFATMSHEIRTPLGTIIGLNEILASTELSDRQRGIVGDIASSSSLLLKIINDILDLAKFESGKIDINTHPAKVEDMTSGVIQTIKEQALEKDLEFNISASSEVPNYILIDLVRIKQVLINLISNAIKFTSKGSVTVSIAAKERENGKLILNFCVADTGIGLTKDQVEHIFDEFAQADSSTTKKYGGTGLGLAICRRIVEAMQGSIWVESELGRGSRFYLSIPCEETSEDSYRELKKGDVEDLLEEVVEKNPRILLAEDHDLNRDIFENLMTGIGLKVESVIDGQKAVEKLKQEAFDLIFMDIQMPNMDGVTATKKIREICERDGRDQPWIIALTANVFREDREEYFRSGFSDFISKPFNRRTLKQGLTNYLLRQTTFIEFDDDPSMTAIPIDTEIILKHKVKRTKS